MIKLSKIKFKLIKKCRSNNQGGKKEDSNQKSEAHPLIQNIGQKNKYKMTAILTCKNIKKTEKIRC